MPNEIQFPGESVEIMAGGLHDPFFFDKLASAWNVVPRTQSEREQLLELATMLREARDTETVKQAGDGNQFLSGAIDSLKVAMSAHGYDTAPTSELIGIKNAAAQIATDPQFQKAALDYGMYLINLEAGNGK
jgi:hypothetical protein